MYKECFLVEQGWFQLAEKLTESFSLLWKNEDKEAISDTYTICQLLINCESDWLTRWFFTVLLKK